ncbi:hypothetical protein, partial [Arthrobacter sp. DR-2P]
CLNGHSRSGPGATSSRRTRTACTQTQGITPPPNRTRASVNAAAPGSSATGRRTGPAD